jgi:hypothetical protein
MVDDKVPGWIDNHAVHFGMYALSLFKRGPDGITGVSATVGVPFIFVQPVVIFGVHDGEFVAGQGYSAEWVAVTGLAV